MKQLRLRNFFVLFLDYSDVHRNRKTRNCRRRIIKRHGTEEPESGGRMRSRLTHGSQAVRKQSYNYQTNGEEDTSAAR